MLTVTGLFIYPIKSLGGIAVSSATVSARGLVNDRRLMLVDEDNRFLSQREWPQMAMLQPTLTDTGLVVRHKKNPAVQISIPLQAAGDSLTEVQIWDDACMAQVYEEHINEWFSEMLSVRCRLVYMPETSIRPVDKRYAFDEEITSFSDGYPMLMIGQSSLDDLNARLSVPVPMDRFRPNIVFEGGEAFCEDTFDPFTINGIHFRCAKPCARCVMTTIDQDTAIASKEPLKTLAGYRQQNNKVLFGQNLVHTGDGVISVGDKIIE